MMNLNTTSNVALLSNNGTSAYETGTQPFSSNALRSYNPDGKRRRKPSATSAMRADMVVMLMNAFPDIRRVKIHDSGIEFQARVRLQGGGIVYPLPITSRTFMVFCLTAFVIDWPFSPILWQFPAISRGLPCFIRKFIVHLSKR